MGQQQLLLLVLGIVIVGLAVVVGIQAFGENQKKANADALVNDGIRIASDAQAWALKPKQFGGGGGSFAGISLENLGYATTDDKYENVNGDFTITEDGGTVTITGCNALAKNQVVVTVDGTSSDDIKTETSTVDSCP